MKTIRVLLIAMMLVLNSTPAAATVFTTASGQFSALASVTTHTDSVNVSGYGICVFQFDVSAGTFVGRLQVSLDNGTNWVRHGMNGGILEATGVSTAVDNGLMFLAGTNGFGTLGTQPFGQVRPELTSCTGCSVVVRWRCEKGP